MIWLMAGDIVTIDSGIPVSSEAGFVRPAVVVSAAGFLKPNLRTLFVVPCTTRRRGAPSHIELVPDSTNGLSLPSWAQVEHLRSISRARCVERLGTVGAVTLAQIREVIALLIDLDPR